MVRTPKRESMSNKALTYLIEKYDKPTQPIRVQIWDYERCAIEMQAYADEQVKKYKESLNVFKLFDCPTQENGLCNCTNKCFKGNKHLKKK